MITVAVPTIRSIARAALAAVRVVSKPSGLRALDRRLPAGAPAPVADAEGPRTRVARWPTTAGAMDFGTRGQRVALLAQAGRMTALPVVCVSKSW
jgi:hypothetical protein